MKICILSTFCLLLTCAVNAQSTRIQKPVLMIGFYGDYHIEDFRWSIAGNSNGQNPNVLSEVIWKDLKGPGVGLDAQLNIWSSFSLEGSYHKTFIRSGKASDTDYADDDRRNPVYMANLNSAGGYTDQYSATLGYALKINEMLEVSPRAGYTGSRQSLLLKHFEEEEDFQQKLNSTYKVSWAGPMIGLRFESFLEKRLSVTAGIDYKQLKYHAEANWNLIDAFAHPVSFKHHANGFELQALLQLNYQLSPLISAFIRGDYYYAETGKGTDELFLVDGQQLKSQFNTAVRKGRGAGVGICLTIR